MVKKIVAVIAGIVTAATVIWAIEAIGHSVYPPPSDIDFSDADQVREMVASLPIGAFAFVILAWVAGVSAGGIVASRLAGEKPALCAGIVGGFVLLGTAVTLSSIPHPTWFSISAVALIVLTTWMTGLYAGRRENTDEQ